MGCCPSSKELRNTEIIGLANRLNASTDKERLTNILEWQDKNIVFWIERWLPSLIFLGSLVVFLVILFELATLPSLLARAWVLLAILGTIPLTTLSLMILVIYYNRKIPLKKLPEGLYNAFRRSLPVNVILENKLAVCRDYAKFTACLLSNIYPNAEILVSISSDHNAAGIKLGKKLYMLDQHLPVSAINNVNKWKSFGFYEIKSLQGAKLKKVDINSVLPKTNPVLIDSQELIQLLRKRITEGLDIREPVVEKQSLSMLFKFEWRNGVKKYEDDEIVNYSIIRGLNNKISDNKVQANLISKLDITTHKNNITFTFMG